VRRRTRLWLAALCCALLLSALGAGAALAGQTQQLDAGVQLIRQPLGKPWTIGLNLSTTITPTDGAEHPSALRHMEFLFPHATVNTRAFPSCKLSRLLKNMALKDCPRRSLLGKGSALADATVITEPATLYMFNGQRKRGNAHFYFVVQPEHISQRFVFDATLARQRGRYGWKLSMDIPPIHVLPNVPDVAIAQFQVNVNATGRLRGRRVPLLQAPTSCPRGGWRFHGTYEYADGSTGTADSTIDCVLHGHP
jgi:hypothetical protein